MNNEPVEIEESDVAGVSPRGDSEYLYLLVVPSPKTDGIRQGDPVTFRGTIYTVKTKGEVGTPGEPVEFALLKIDKAEGYSA